MVDRFNAEYRGITMTCLVDDSKPGELFVNMDYPNGVVPDNMNLNYRYKCKPGGEQSALESVYKSLCSKIDASLGQNATNGSIKEYFMDSVTSEETKLPNLEQKGSQSADAGALPAEIKESGDTSSTGEDSTVTVKKNPDEGEASGNSNASSLYVESPIPQNEGAKEETTKKKKISAIAVVAFILVFAFNFFLTHYTDFHFWPQTAKPSKTAEEYYTQNTDDMKEIEDSINAALPNEFDHFELSAQDNQIIFKYVLSYEPTDEQKQAMVTYLEERDEPEDLAELKSWLEDEGAKDVEVRIIYVDINGTVISDKTY